MEFHRKFDLFFFFVVGVAGQTSAFFSRDQQQTAPERMTSSNISLLIALLIGKNRLKPIRDHNDRWKKARLSY